MGGDEQIWATRIIEATTREKLVTLEHELSAIDADWVRPLRVRIGVRKAKLAGRPAAKAPIAQAVRYGVAAPYGRPLYAYRVTDTIFKQLQRDLANRPGLSSLEDGDWPALFTLWASEWFRRSYVGNGHRWQALTDTLGMIEDQTTLRRIASTGLRAWSRPIIHISGGNEYLGTLAREGGFPTAAVREGTGWAHEVLRRIVAPLLGEPMAGAERALELASRQEMRLPQLFRDHEFIQLCADLALAIVAVRREADLAAAKEGLPVGAWLQLRRPDWRDALPLATGDRAADDLIDQLLRVEPVSGAQVGVERLLVRDGKGWHEAARINFDGAFDSVAMRGIAARDERLRAFAAGVLSRAAPGELAMIEPPAEGETVWLARATRLGRSILPVPLAAAIEIDLRSGERQVERIGLPGGGPRRGQLLVAEGHGDAPDQLKILGSGSGQYRAEALYLQVPENWQVSAMPEETVAELGPGVGATRLWRIGGGALVVDDCSDRYRIRCGQQKDAGARLELIGKALDLVDVSSAVDLFSGAPFARGGGPGSLYVREIGSRSWRPAPSSLPIGHYEIGLRQDGILLDRRRIAVLPATARLSRHGTGMGLRYAVEGFEGATIAPAPDAPVLPAGDRNEWRARPVARPVHRFAATISWPGQPDLAVTIGFPSPAAIARWEGAILPDKTELVLSDLADLVAVNDGRMELFAELIDPPAGKVADMAWGYDRELPMGAVAADIASLLLPALSIDASVRLGMLDGIETYWHVRLFRTRLDREGAGFVALGAVLDLGARLVGRALADPALEVDFGAYSLLSDANHRPAELPALAGTWLIYLRAGRTILSRPILEAGQSSRIEPATTLGRAMVQPWPQLRLALNDLLEVPEEALIAELLALIASLDGLPPATFEVLKQLAARPALLARLAVAAAPEQRDAVLALSEALPFAWCMIPIAAWETAQRTAFETLLAKLAGLGDQAPRFAIESVAVICAALVKHEPLLGPVISSAKTDVGLEQVAQIFLGHAIDRIRGRSNGRYRQQLGDSLPAYFLRFSEHCLDTLDAPCAAALAVTGVWTPRPDDIRHIKSVARTFPTFFGDAFAAALREYR